MSCSFYLVPIKFKEPKSNTGKTIFYDFSIAIIMFRIEGWCKKQFKMFI